LLEDHPELAPKEIKSPGLASAEIPE
jgi:hypothetical protein